MQVFGPKICYDAGAENWSLPADPFYGSVLLHLGFAYGRAGESYRARTVLEVGISVAELVYGKDSPELLLPLNNLANACNALGDKNTKWKHLRRALEICEACDVEAGQPQGAPYWSLPSTRANYQAVDPRGFGTKRPERAAILLNFSDIFLEVGQPEEKRKMDEKVQKRQNEKDREAASRCCASSRTSTGPTRWSSPPRSGTSATPAGTSGTSRPRGRTSSARTACWSARTGLFFL